MMRIRKTTFLLILICLICVHLWPTPAGIKLTNENRVFVAIVHARLLTVRSIERSRCSTFPHHSKAVTAACQATTQPSAKAQVVLVVQLSPDTLPPAPLPTTTQTRAHFQSSLTGEAYECAVA